MKKEFKGAANKGGVYQIQNLVNEKKYIGSAKCFKKRANQHENRLNQGKHQNKHLLASWKKYGSQSFLFEVLEVVEGDKLQRTTREKHILDQYLGNWEMCYNFQKIPLSNERTCWSKTKDGFSKEHKKKISMSMQGKQNALDHTVSKQTRKVIANKIKKIRNLEAVKQKQSKISKTLWENKKYKEKLREIHKNRSKAPSVRKHLSNISSKHYLVTSPDEKIFEVINLKKFCIAHNLNYCLMNKVASGKLRHYKKWSVRKYDDNITKFCRK